ncbi:helix-turn-helix transcriptional regulator [Pelagibius litoralis]|uniref:helix-turn-helix transcriptional regulator n=1 Tax=Pelagibius litoralis TaxID=374515 RepID=UPI002AC354DC|nr:helix-turn-helix transcriptional regulator [Pelagibius litoralis]
MSNKNLYYKKMSFSPGQCHAARGLLNLSQSEVAEPAHVTAATLSQFERYGKAPGYNNLQAIRATLEAAGIAFIPANGGGPGVRLRELRSGCGTSETLFFPDLCRAARNILNMSQWDLAEAAGIARSTVAEFERGARVPISNNLQAMRDALEAAGVAFIEADGSAGPGVRLRK